MPFQKGNKLSTGRPPMEIEQAQLEKMRKILDRDLKMVEKIQSEKDIDETTQKKLILLRERVSKYMDKLHIPKVDMNIKSEVQVELSEAQKIAQEFKDKIKKI